MSWRKAAGGLAVLLVIGMVGAVVGSIATTNELLSSDVTVPALVALGLVVVAFAVTVVVAKPSRDWFANPYW